jgi:diacylglycerol O-acyltransferase / wax synthase
VPVAFLPENHALAVAIMSYNGKVDFGLLADYDAMPDVDAFAAHLGESLAELLEAARGASKTRASSNGSKKDSTPGTARKKQTTS